ncbi:hypothetical protein OAD66_09235, partial [Bacteroidia bacterium]|nr:hypothetical protein [Bacteroidia bacterium]
MAGGKVSPRQKMINMMYLVLTALLALNVSKEILKSFHLFEKSFDNAAKNIDAKNEATMGALLKSAEEKPLKTKPYLDRAKKAEGIASDFMKYVDGLISNTEEMYGGAEARNEEGELLAADQMEQHANYFGEENENHGVELQAKINETREALLDILKPDPTDSFYNIKDNKVYDNALASCQLWAKDAEGGVSQSSWVSENLVHVPAAGLMAIFSRLKNDAKTLEAEVLEQ